MAEPQLLTTRQTAELVGLTPVTLRSIARFARNRGFELRAPKEEWPDARTVMYDAAKVVEYLEVQRPAREWVVSTEEQRAIAAERKAEFERKRAEREARRQAEIDAAVAERLRAGAHH